MSDGAPHLIVRASWYFGSLVVSSDHLRPFEDRFASVQPFPPAPRGLSYLVARLSFPSLFREVFPWYQRSSTAGSAVVHLLALEAATKSYLVD